MYPAESSNPGYTYRDYLTWQDDTRWQLIDGERSMVPAPNVPHQTISALLTMTILNQLIAAGSPCRLLAAPVDVVLAECNVVQPDLLIVCDPEKITRRHIRGAPDCIFEILSPSTGAHDRTVKFQLYQRFGVQTYLLVHPVEAYVEVFDLVDGVYGGARVYTRQQLLTMEHPRLAIDLTTIFTDTGHEDD